jgi:autoinducer 2-degrading protein
MYGGLARFVVKPGRRDEFVEVLRWSARVARESEPGTLRLDTWEVDGEENVIYGYEAYRDVAAFEEHVGKNPAVQHFGKVMNDLVEGWTFVIPFGENLSALED